MLSAVVNDVVGIRLRTRFRYDVGLRQLTLFLIRNAADCDESHISMPGHDPLNLRGVNVVACRQNHVFFAVYNKNTAVLIHRGDIACVQPAVWFNGVPSGLLVAVVTLHDHTALDHQLADLSYR